VLDSPGYRALSITAQRILTFLLSEHLSHGGKENGRLMCPYNQLVRMGCSRHAIAPAIDELERFGLVKFTKGDRLGGRPGATRARITFYTVDGKMASATNDYKRITMQTVEQFRHDQRTHRAVRRKWKRDRKAGPPADAIQSP